MLFIMVAKKTVHIVVSFIILPAMLLSLAPLGTDERIKIAAEMENSLQKELLSKWYPQAIDTAWGGFLSAFTYDFKPTGPQDKMIVSQARHTWTNAKASLLYPAVN